MTNGHELGVTKEAISLSLLLLLLLLLLFIKSVIFN